MKNLIFAVIFVFLGMSSHAETTPPLELNQGKMVYSVGDKLVLIASLRMKPTQANTEVFMEAELNDQPIKITRISETEAGTVSPEMTASGNNVWKVRAFLQDRDFAKNIALSIIKSENKIAELEDLLAIETDLAKKALLQDAIDAESVTNLSLENTLASHRVLLAEEALSVDVYEVRAAASDAPPSLRIYTNREDNTFVFGEPIRVFFEFSEGLGGPTKNELFPSVNYYTRTAEKVSNDLYTLDLEERDFFMSEISVSAYSYYRNKFYSDSYQDAYAKASTMSTHFYLLAETTVDPYLKQYYQRESDHLTRIQVALWDLNDRIRYYGTSEAISITITPAPPQFRKVSAGGDFACGIFGEDLYCWGMNGYGQLATENYVSTTMPIYPVSLSGGVGSVDAGDQHVCATRYGRLYCWGNALYGRIGNGETTGSFVVPIAIYPFENLRQVSAGARHTCAIEDKSLYCWGYNGYGEVGDGTITNAAHPVNIMNDVIKVSAGTNITCAITTAKELYCWGKNDKGQLGQGSTSTASLVPIKVPSINDASEVSVGDDNVCVIDGGKGKCWGSNLAGLLGTGWSGDYSYYPIVVAGLESGVSHLSVSTQAMCMILNGSGRCMGSPQDGALGNGFFGGASPFPSQVIGIYSNAIDISEGKRFGCAVHGAELKCWGKNYGGNLGDGSATGNVAIPVVVIDPGTKGK
ncbi:hypothetical protein EZJ49_09240 [Bdellovibrio bacteriovorus]|uniref:RCC1 domain-containing protein n=1 Tax=Bdellovibrio bacteriovorus TaxID=959 RepID=UPI0021D016A2|nr:RCC1 domain-containing protein [Bdellovibrio bacteriovorus]UXR63262.1 hypothetical protein EZJ49_09240 [Bdellovibrio bacteriovorus]